jgi:hypothetical protein
VDFLFAPFTGASARSGVGSALKSLLASPVQTAQGIEALLSTDSLLGPQERIRVFELCDRLAHAPQAKEAIVSALLAELGRAWKDSDVDADAARVEAAVRSYFVQVEDPAKRVQALELATHSGGAEQVSRLLAKFDPQAPINPALAGSLGGSLDGISL